MKILSEEYFIDKSGFAFENLIKELLYEEYGQIFEHTSLTNDGGKDFQTTDTDVLANQKIWAECKKYSNALSYNDITKTLLMAYIETIHKVLIFSFSPVNKRFYKNLAIYKNKTNIEVEVYDDINLENLLLKYRKKEWFSTYIILPEEIGISCLENAEKDNSKSLIQYKYDFSGIHKSNTQNNLVYVNMYELFSVDLLIINKSMQEKEICIDYSAFEKCDYFELLDDKINYENNYQQHMIISKCTAILIKLHLRAVKYQNSYNIPFIYINKHKVIIRKKLYTTWLAETELLGDIYRQYRAEIYKFISSAQKLNFIGVEGDTGIGKSKFLKDLYQLSHSQKQKCFLCDIDKKRISVQILCQELFSFFSNLPFFKKDVKKTAHLLNLEKDNMQMWLAYNVLYNDTFNYKDNIHLIATCIFNYLKREKYLIIVDNLQKFDLLSLEIIEEIIILSSNQHCTSSIILSFNTNYVGIGTKAHKLMEQIKYLDSRKHSQYHRYELPGFDTKLAKEYIYKCLGISIVGSKKYKNISNKIIALIGTNPMLLQNYFILLYKKHVIEVEKSYFIIRDLGYFYNDQKDKLNIFGQLLSEIEELILKELETLSDQAEYLNLIGCLTIFKELSRNITKKLIKNMDLIDSLINHGIIFYNPNNSSYSFRHIEILRYYKFKYGLNYIEANTVLATIKQSKFVKHYLEGIFLLEFDTENIQKTTFNKILEKIYSSKIDYDNLEAIYNKVLILIQNGFVEEYEYALKIMNHICHNATQILGIEKALIYQENIFDIIAENITRYSSYVNLMLNIFKEYLRHLMNEGRIENAVNVNHKMKKLKKYINDQEQQRYYLNELYKLDILTSYKSMDSKNALLIADKLIQSNQNDDMGLAECYMFIGNVYYHTFSSYTEISNIALNWKNAYERIKNYIFKYDSVDYNTKSIILNVIIKNCLANILDKQICSEKDIDFLQNILNKTKMPYFEVKIRQFFALHSIIIEQNDSKKQAIQYIEETLDILSASYGNKILYATSLFILAEIYKGIHDYNKMYTYFLGFYGVLSQCLGEEKNKTKDYLIVEMAISLRAYKAEYSMTLDLNIFNNIPSENLYNQIRHILLMPDSKFRSFYAVNKRTSLFFNEKLEINYPLI